MTDESGQKPVEGDFVESLERILFSVKGIIHPPNHIIAFPKYIPNEDGERGHGRRRYAKISSVAESIKYMKKKFPQYLRLDPFFNQKLSEIPTSSIRKIYYAKRILQKINRKANPDKAEKEALTLAKLISKKAQIHMNRIGLSGSIMLGLHRENSDIDLIIHGEDEAIKTYRTLRTLDNERIIHRYSEKDLEKLFDFRVQDTDIPFNQFIRIENKKLLQGKFGNREYFIRLLKKPDEFGEKYGDKTYLPQGTIELEAEIEESNESIFTPCKYTLAKSIAKSGAKSINIKEAVSFRGRFCEQAEVGDRVFIRGKLEKVTINRGKYFRIVIGESRKDILLPLKVR